MKINVSRAELGTTSTWVSNGLPKRPVLPVLHGIRVTVAEGKLTLAMFDFEQARRGWLNGEDAEDGQILVDGAKLKKVITGLPKGTRVRVQVSADADTLTITAGDITWTLPAVNDAEYPALPPLPAQVGIADGAAFARSVQRVAVAASTDDTLPMLTAVHFDPAASVIDVAATDRYRLAWDALPWTAADPEQDVAAFLVDAKVAVAFAKDAAKYGKVTIHYSAPTVEDTTARIAFRDDSRELITRPVSGEFIRYKTRIPGDSPINLTADAKLLAGVVKLMGAAADRRLRWVDLSFAQGKVLVQGINEDGTVAAAQQVDATADVPEFSVRFHEPYLRPLLEGIDGQVVLGISPNRLTRVIPVDQADPFQAIVVPVRIAQ